MKKLYRMNIDGYIFNLYCYPNSIKHRDVCSLNVTRLMSNVYDTTMYLHNEIKWEKYDYQTVMYATLNCYQSHLTQFMKKSILLRNSKKRWSKRFDAILDEEKRHNCEWKALMQAMKNVLNNDAMKQYLVMERI